MAKNTVLSSLGERLGRPIIACGENMKKHMVNAYTEGVVLKDFSGSKSWWVRNTVSPAVATAELTGNVVIGALRFVPDHLAGYRRLRVDKRDGHTNYFDPAHPKLMVVSEHSLNRKYSDKKRRFPRVTNPCTRIATHAYMNQGGYILLNDSANFKLAEKHLSAMGAGSKKNTIIVSNYGACMRYFDTNGVKDKVVSRDIRLSKAKVKALRDMLGQSVQGKDSLYMMSAHTDKKVYTVSAERNGSDALDLLKYKFGSRQRASLFESKNEDGFSLGTQNEEFYNIVVQPAKPCANNKEARLDNMQMLFKIAKARDEKIRELDLDKTLTDKQKEQQLKDFDKSLDFEIQFARDGAIVFTERGVSKRALTKDVKAGLGVDSNDIGMRVTSVTDIIPSFSMLDFCEIVEKLEIEYDKAHPTPDHDEKAKYISQILLSEYYKPDKDIFDNVIANGIYTGAMEDSELQEIEELREIYFKNLRLNKRKKDLELTGYIENADFADGLAKSFINILIPQSFEEKRKLENQLDELAKEWEAKPKTFTKENEYKKVQEDLQREENYIEFRTRHATDLVMNLFELNDIEMPTNATDASISNQVFKMQNLGGPNGILSEAEQKARQEKRKDAMKKFQDFLGGRYTDQKKEEMIREILTFSIEINNGNLTYTEAWDKTIESIDKKIDEIEKEEKIALHAKKLTDISKLDASLKSMEILQNNLKSLLPPARVNYENNTSISADDKEVIVASMNKMTSILTEFMGDSTIEESQKKYASIQYEYFKAMYDIITHKKNDIHYQDRLDAEARAKTLFEQAEAIYALKDDPVAYFDHIEEQLNNIIPDQLPFFIDNVVLTPEQESQREFLLNQVRSMVSFYNAGIAENIDSFKTNLADMKYRKELANYLNYSVELMERNVSKHFTQTVKDEEAKLDQLLMTAGAAYAEKTRYDDADDQERSEILALQINDIAAQINGTNLDDDKRKEIIKDYESYALEFQRVRRNYQAHHPVDADAILADNAYIELIKSHIHLNKIDEFVPTNDPNTQEGLDEIKAETDARAERYRLAQDQYTAITTKTIEKDKTTQVGPTQIIHQHFYYDNRVYNENHDHSSYDFSTTNNITNNYNMSYNYYINNNYNNISFSFKNDFSYYSLVDYFTLLDPRYSNEIDDATKKKEDEIKKENEPEDEYNLPNGRKLVKLELTELGRKQVEEQLAEINEIHKELIKAEFGINPEKKEDLIKTLVSKYNDIKSTVDSSMTKEYRKNNVAKYAFNTVMGLHANIGGQIKRKEVPSNVSQSWEEYKDSPFTDRIKLEMTYIKEILERGVEVDREGAIYIKDYKIANNKRDTQEKIKKEVNTQLVNNENPHSFIVDYAKLKIKEANDNKIEFNQVDEFGNPIIPKRPSLNIAYMSSLGQESIYQEILNGIVDGADMKWELAKDDKSLKLTLSAEPQKGIKYLRRITIDKEDVEKMGVNYEKLRDNIIAEEKAKVEELEAQRQAETQSKEDSIKKKLQAEADKKAKAQKEAEDAKRREAEEAQKEQEEIQRLEAEKAKLAEEKAKADAEKLAKEKAEQTKLEQFEAQQKEKVVLDTNSSAYGEDLENCELMIEALVDKKKELYEIAKTGNKKDREQARKELVNIEQLLKEQKSERDTLKKLIKSEASKVTDLHQGMTDAIKSTNQSTGEDLYLKAIKNADHNSELDGEKVEEVQAPVIEIPENPQTVEIIEPKPVKTGQTSLDDFSEFTEFTPSQNKQ